MRYVRLALKYGLAALGAWLVLMSIGQRMDPAYWERILTIR
jgi:hypothetical protein